MIPQEADQFHRKIPPCSCRQCLRAIAAADQRRAEIETILRRFDELDLKIRLASELEREAGQ